MKTNPIAYDTLHAVQVIHIDTNPMIIPLTGRSDESILKFDEESYIEYIEDDNTTAFPLRGYLKQSNDYNDTLTRSLDIIDKNKHEAIDEIRVILVKFNLKIPQLIIYKRTNDPRDIIIHYKDSVPIYE